MRLVKKVLFLSENTTMYICLLTRMEPEVHCRIGAEKLRGEGGGGDKRELKRSRIKENGTRWGTRKLDIWKLKNY
jgi:hypothetical protein